MKDFIINNGLSFSGTGSGLNSNIVILVGYSLFKGYTLTDLLRELKVILEEELHSHFIDEVTRVYNYADAHNYGEYWKTEKATQTYKF